MSQLLIWNSGISDTCLGISRANHTQRHERPADNQQLNANYSHNNTVLKPIIVVARLLGWPSEQHFLRIHLTRVVARVRSIQSSVFIRPSDDSRCHVLPLSSVNYQKFNFATLAAAPQQKYVKSWVHRLNLFNPLRHFAKPSPNFYGGEWKVQNFT